MNRARTGPALRDRTYGLPRFDDARSVALSRLRGAIADAHDRDLNVPCCGAAWRDWTDDDPEVAVRAAARCRSCPVLTVCASYVAAHPEPAGTWAIQPASARARGFRLDQLNTFAASVCSSGLEEQFWRYSR